MLHQSEDSEDDSPTRHSRSPSPGGFSAPVQRGMYTMSPFGRALHDDSGGGPQGAGFRADAEHGKKAGEPLEPVTEQ